MIEPHPLDDASRSPSRRHWVWILSLMLLTIALGGGIAFHLDRQQQARVSQETLDRVERGMSEATIMKLLGTPDLRHRKFGLVDPDGTSFTINPSTPRAKLKGRGFQDYDFLQWSSRSTTIIVILDSSNTVASRYSKPRSPMQWYEHLFEYLTDW